MRPLEEVRDELLASLAPLPTEVIPLADAAGLTLASSPTSPIAVPPVDTVGMDGYAVQANDLRQTPRHLRIIGRVAPGESFGGRVSAGTAVRVFTGAPLPEGSDAVIRQEDTIAPGTDPQIVEILSPAKPWEYIRLRGEDVG